MYCAGDTISFRLEAILKHVRLYLFLLLCSLSLFTIRGLSMYDKFTIILVIGVFLYILYP